MGGGWRWSRLGRRGLGMRFRGARMQGREGKEFFLDGMELAESVG